MIRGFSEPKRVPRVGKIYLGVKTANNEGKSYPKAVDYFVVRADGINTSQAAADAFHAVYGTEPRELTIAFPSNDREVFMPQYLTAYRGGGGRSELWCKGDGITARRADGRGGIVEIPCEYQNCPIFQEKKCKTLTRLLFLLPDVPGIGIWELATTSYFSAQNLGASIQLIEQVTFGRISMIPLTLRVVPMTVSPEGQMKTVYVLDLQLERVSLMEVLNRVPRLGGAKPMQLDVPTDEMPDDLYVDDSLVKDADIPQPSGSGPSQGQRTAGQRSQRQMPPHVVDADVVETPASPASQSNAATDKGAVFEVAFKPVGQQNEEIARVKLASVTGEIHELLTAEPALVEKLRTITDGTAIEYRAVTSKRWKNRMELAEFTVLVS